MKNSIKVLIVDDERYSRDELKHLLSNFEIIDVIGEAESGEEAIMKCLQLHPDVVFLDIEMGNMNGMETAKGLHELKKTPLLVFATAYPDFAVEAFRHEAIDYILKPFEEEQIKETVNRISTRLIKPSEGAPASPARLAIEGEDEILYISPKEILYIYRDDRVTKIVTTDNQYETKMPIKELETRLKGYEFFRIHKSYLVNLSYVSRLIPWFNGAYHLELIGKKEQLSVSRNYVKALRMKLEL
ncbi:LytR/AlgR family response regulator transcription factor [Metabacillus arenae]|uniref:Response regulator transcription factor n=1 Tax=Metabacillus arenae TaxID=2771434 RepID=A0A926RY53_9BACI|nr:LytTR family DNA-binding domain-containing protein [Metabacillus arenae]MBD1381350.1 response regulator transcription factor [Metabacillus arenae]